jgi:single-strand DNA-binding protein
MSLNKVMLIGNVGRDPEVRYFDGNSSPNGNSKVARFTLATTERYRDRSGELRENTEWHNIVAWRNSAELAEKYIRKGSQIYVEGKLSTRTWTDQSGAKRTTTEVVVDNIQLLGRRDSNASDGGNNGGYASAPQGGYPQQGYSRPTPQPAAQPSQPYQPAYQQPYQPQSQPVQAPQAPQVQQPAPEAPSLEVGLDVVDDLPF